MNIKSPKYIFDKYADYYSQKYDDQSLYREPVDICLSQITQKNPKVLELACGPGNLTQLLLSINPNLDVLATDIAPNMIQIARSKSINAKFEILDCTHINQLDQSYDAVICAFGLPYLTQQQTFQLVNDATSMLNEKGVIYLSFMEGPHSDSGVKASSKGDDACMIYIHEQSYITEYLVNKGLEVIYTQKYPSPNKSEEVDCIIIARKPHLHQ